MALQLHRTLQICVLPAYAHRLTYRKVSPNRPPYISAKDAIGWHLLTVSFLFRYQLEYFHIFRYLQPPEQWIKCSLESRELLGICLARLKGLNRVRLIDAGFLWTEPHSKRIKVKLTIQAEVVGGAVLQQVFVVDFIVNGQFCSDCHRVEAKDFWKANVIWFVSSPIRQYFIIKCHLQVQVRQKTDHKKTFYYLEQLILKHKAHESTLGIKPAHEGIDFFYANQGQARKMVDFLTSVVPCRYQVSKTVVSQDVHNNTFNCKFTFSVEIVPVCKDCVVCLSPKLAHQLGGIGQICVVQRVSHTVHLIDPSTAQSMIAFFSFLEKVELHLKSYI